MTNEPGQTELAVSDDANEMTTVVSYQQQTGSDEQDNDEHHDDDDEYASCKYLEFSIFLFLFPNSNIAQFDWETKFIAFITDKPHKKPQNHNENQIIVETNPVNNIHVEAPMITTIIGHPIVEQVPGLIELFFFVKNNQ